MTAIDMAGVATDMIRELDPFAFFAGHASAIKPLGGTERGPDPKYGFHTLYFEYRPGPIIFTIRFHDLKVTTGELGIHLNAYVPASGNNATLVGALRRQMTEIADSGGEVSLRVSAIAGVTYAVFGYLPDYTDAQASGITITVQELGSDEVEIVPAEALEPSRFGTAAVERPSALLDNGPPRFKDPVSQVMTPRQLEEPACLGWIGTFPAAIADPSAAWSRAFVLQALARYGMLETGARGLALGDGDGIVAATIMRRGCSVTTGLPGTDAGTYALNPALAPDDMLRIRSSIRTLDLAELPPDLRGFDFVWSLHVVDRADISAVFNEFIHGAMRTLRPGGLAVHVFDLAITDATRSVTRKAIERLALTLIARNHEIAQLNFGHGLDADAPYLESPSSSSRTETVPFGLIVRRSGGGRI